MVYDTWYVHANTFEQPNNEQPFGDRHNLLTNMFVSCVICSVDGDAGKICVCASHVYGSHAACYSFRFVTRANSEWVLAVSATQSGVRHHRELAIIAGCRYSSTNMSLYKYSRITTTAHCVHKVCKCLDRSTRQERANIYQTEIIISGVLYSARNLFVFGVVRILTRD